MKRGVLIGLLVVLISVFAVSVVSAGCPTGTFLKTSGGQTFCCKQNQEIFIDCGSASGCYPTATPLRCCSPLCDGTKKIFDSKTQRCIGGLICNVGENVCGNVCMDPKVHNACCGKVGSTCIDKKPYNTLTQACCGYTNVFDKLKQCCLSATTGEVGTRVGQKCVSGVQMSPEVESVGFWQKIARFFGFGKNQVQMSPGDNMTAVCTEDISLIEGEVTEVSFRGYGYKLFIVYVSANDLIIDVNGVQTNKLSEGNVFKTEGDNYLGVMNILYNAKEGGISKAVVKIASSSADPCFIVKSCADSDNGENYTVKGIAQGYPDTIQGATYDCCKSSSAVGGACVDSGAFLYEAICSGSSPSGVMYACPYGCKDGVCLNKVVVPVVKERVNCVFSNARTIKKCYTSDNKFSCSGLGKCSVSVSGNNGTKLTWKSYCGGAVAYTKIDGLGENANFNCKASL